MKAKMRVMGNWKMNLLPAEAEQLTHSIVKDLSGRTGGAEVVLFPPFPYLPKVSEICENTLVLCGAQNVAATEVGAYTGEVSAKMIKACGGKFALVGHSERRQYYAEEAQILYKKMEQLIATGLGIVYCVGETLEHRRAHRQYEIVGDQLNSGLMGLQVPDAGQIVIAYEPVWAIGTGEVATPEQAAEVHKFIRRQLATLFPMFAPDISILYGGSVNAENAAGLFTKENINGALVGGASLKSQDFTAIINAADAAIY
jgi:triosephosphate isomerase